MLSTTVILISITFVIFLLWFSICKKEKFTPTNPGYISTPMYNTKSGYPEQKDIEIGLKDPIKADLARNLIGFFKYYPDKSYINYIRILANNENDSKKIASIESYSSIKKEKNLSISKVLMYM